MNTLAPAAVPHINKELFAHCVCAVVVVALVGVSSTCCLNNFLITVEFHIQFHYFLPTFDVHTLNLR